MPATRALAVAVVALAGGSLAQYLFVREHAGINVLVATAAFLAAAWALRVPGRVRARDLWAPAGAVLFASLCALRADAPLLTFDALAAIVLSGATVAALRGVGLTDLALAPLATAALDTIAAAVAGLAPVWRDAARELSRRAPRRSSPVAGYVGGLALAVPLLFVFGALFSSADAVFDRRVRDLLELSWLREMLAYLPTRIVVALATAWAVGGALASLARAATTREDGSGRALVPTETVTAMLLAVDILFVAFVGLQIAYLFGGRDTLDAAGIAYSAYARRGFFELVTVAGLVGGLLFVVDLVARARVAYRSAALLLVALTTVVLASAAMRLGLYQEAYGWTELRFYAAVAIAYLAVALAMIAWAVVRSRMAVVVQRLALAGLVAALGANAIGPSATVARANIERFTGSAPLPEDAYRDLDLGHLMSLGDGALPIVVDALPSLPEPQRSRLAELVRFAAAHRPASGGWQSWNLERTRADELLSRP